MERQEGLSETRREGCLRFRDSVFGARHLGRVTRDEVEHDLFGSDFGDDGEDAAGVAGEQDDVGRMRRGQARDFGVSNVLDGVGAGGGSIQSR
jgi:hypothetical protein